MRIQRQSLVQKARALRIFTLLQSNCSQHRQSQRSGGRVSERLARLRFCLVHLSLAQQLRCGLNMIDLGRADRWQDNKGETKPVPAACVLNTASAVPGEVCTLA